MNGRSRREYLEAIHSRYRRADGTEKRVILSEFCRNTGYNRKYAIRLLNGPPPHAERERPRRQRRAPTYSGAVISILGSVWEAAGYPCAVRLKALLPLWMPWVRKRFRPTAATVRALLRISARQIDRRLEERKKRAGHRLYGRTKPGRLLQHLIPLRTDHWHVKMPGFAEVDLVSHSGSSASGEFAYSLNLTDVHTGWTETRAILARAARQFWTLWKRFTRRCLSACRTSIRIMVRNSSTGTWALGALATRCSSRTAALTKKTTMPTSSKRTGRTSAS